MHRIRLIGFGFLLASAVLWAGAFMPLLPLVVARIGWRGVTVVATIPGYLMGLAFLLLPCTSLGGAPRRVEAMIETPPGARGSTRCRTLFPPTWCGSVGK